MKPSASPASSPRRAHFTLRAVGFFVLFLCLGALLYYGAYHYHPNVGVFTSDEERSDLIYRDQTYHFAGVIGEKKLHEKTYPVEKILGELKPSLPRSLHHSDVLFSVKDKKNLLLLQSEDGKKHLYYLDGTDNPAKPDETETAAG